MLTLILAAIPVLTLTWVACDLVDTLVRRRMGLRVK